MESNYPAIQTPQPITAHNYKVVKVIKERKLAKRRNKRTFRQWVPVSRVLGIKKQALGPLGCPCSFPSVGGREKKHFFGNYNLKGRKEWKTGL